MLRRGANSLNFLRLVLASLVIVSHSIASGGFHWAHFLGNADPGSLAVDAFFGISGYLICASALRMNEFHGRWKGLFYYLRDRVLRIFPAFWLCLIVTAVFFGVIGWLATHPSLGGYWNHPYGPTHYVKANSALAIRAWTISGTLAHVPYPMAWNASLWTLEWEFFCYLGVGLLAVLGLLVRRPAVVGIALASWFFEIAMYVQPAHLVLHSQFVFIVRFAPIYLVGTLCFLYRDKIPDSGWLALGLTALACLGLTTGQKNLLFSDWLTGPALVYPVLWLGAHLPCRRIAATNDISYGVYIYGFPVSQLMAIARVQSAGYIPFMLASLACTIPFAAASWWGLEKWALKARNWKPIERLEPALS